MPESKRASEPPRSLGKISLPAPAPRLIPGHRLDRYELLCPIAQGGMASVWVARIQGVHGFEKLVAVKTILAEYATDPQYEAMFLNEARLIASIRHHNVAEILDLGSHDSLLYLVLEWIEGDSLALLERSASRHKRPIPVPVGLRIVAQMCAGLNAAHELRDRSGRRLNVVHRDVSPQNVLVSVTGEVKLIDFGIAKALDQLTTNTSTGVLKGKIAFMSPEQALGLPLDARADIWSAGVVLYQLLTGQLPFRGTGQLETLHIIGACKRVAPIPGLPTILQRLLDRVLEPDREKRIGSAAELESELERVAAQLGPATTRDLAAVVREHLGVRVSERHATIETALLAADGRQKLTQVFDAAIERARRSDDPATEAFLLKAGSATDTEVDAPLTLTAPQPSVPSQTTGVVKVGRRRSHAPTSTKPERYASEPLPAKRARLRPVAILCAGVFAIAGLIAALSSRGKPGTRPQKTAVEAPSASTAALVPPSPPTQTPTQTPTLSPVEASALPLAVEAPSHSAATATRKAPHVVRPPAKRDVWSAFSEHR